MRNSLLATVLTLSAMILGLASCQKHEATLHKGVTDVTISVAIPQRAQLKSNDNPGSGDMVNRCILEIYDSNSALVGERLVSTVESLGTTFSTNLVSGQTYTFVFWADNATGTSPDNYQDHNYNTTSLSAVTITHTDTYLNSDDSRDAFFCSEQRTVDGTALAFELKRPFGQVNIYTNDRAHATAVDPAAVTVQVTFSNVPTTIDLINGGTLADTKGTWGPAAAATPANLTAKEQISFDYIFAAANTQSIVTMDVQVLSGSTVLSSYNSTNIPVQRNYRTNVTGDFLTASTDINVGITPDPDGSTTTGEQITTGLTLTAVTDTPAADGATMNIPTSISKHGNGKIRPVLAF